MHGILCFGCKKTEEGVTKYSATFGLSFEFDGILGLGLG